MKLEVDYSSRLKEILIKEALKTNTAITIYMNSIEHHNSWQQNSEYENMKNKIRELPQNALFQLGKQNIPQYLQNLVKPNSWQYSTIINTLKSNYKKSNNNRSKNTQFAKDITKVLIQCIPLFLLESTSDNPRWKMFDIKDKKVKHYIPLPSKRLYETDITHSF